MYRFGLQSLAAPLSYITELFEKTCGSDASWWLASDTERSNSVLHRTMLSRPPYSYGIALRMLSVRLQRLRYARCPPGLRDNRQDLSSATLAAQDQQFRAIGPGALL
jgi:hypothetical protein